ncbi:MAG: tetratricopeptide repeat protein [Acidobacteriota bacterium]|nr:tetratricopeptide repeat protein [Acidobacteriota bacterium]
MTEEIHPAGAVEVFYSYSHKDEKLRDTLEEHLALLKRQGVISQWHDRGIGAGREWAGEIDEHLKSADIVLLLVSSSFIASDYCYGVELQLAMERHEAGAARIIPVILRPCDWKKAPFGKLQALPKNARPVTKWSNRDDAFTDIAGGIRRVAEELVAKRQAGAATPDGTARKGQATDAGKNPPTGTAQSQAAVAQTASPIPRPPTVGFVARRDEQGRDILARLREELAPGKGQLVALWGPGGAGKTTLAAEVARSLRADFPQRLAWVSALGRVEFGLATLLDYIATQLGRADLRRLAPDVKAEQVRGLLSASPSLVVLDNFETIKPDEQAHCAAFLAEQTDCSALLTTREYINRPDLRNVRLAAMEPEDAREFWRRLVELSGRPAAFAGLDADDLIQRCEANPLVMQWVAGQIELAQRPRDALVYLAQGQGDAAERVFARSFNLPQLGDDGRASLLALSLFTPDASREALAEVAGFGDDLRRLDKAVEALSSLWLIEATAGNERLFLRGLTRELAKSRLPKHERADEFRQRFVAHFQRHALAHPQPMPKDVDALEAEKDNLLGAIDTAFETQDWGSVMRIRAALEYFLDLRGYWNEAVRSGEQGEAAARALKNDGSISYFTMCLAKFRWQRGEYEEAERACREALESFIRLGDEENIAACLQNLGILAQEQGKLEEAKQFHLACLEISKGLSKQDGVAGALHELAIIAQNQGDLKEAQRLYTESLEITEKLNDHRSRAITLNQLGVIANLQGQVEDARRFYGMSLQIRKMMGDQIGIAMTSSNLGLLEEKEGNKAEAARLFRVALTIFEKLGSPKAVDARRDLARIEG